MVTLATTRIWAIERWPEKTQQWYNRLAHQERFTHQFHSNHQIVRIFHRAHQMHKVIIAQAGKFSTHAWFNAGFPPICSIFSIALIQLHINRFRWRAFAFVDNFLFHGICERCIIGKCVTFWHFFVDFFWINVVQRWMDVIHPFFFEPKNFQLILIIFTLVALQFDKQCASSRIRSMWNATKSSTIPSATAAAATSATATAIGHNLLNSTVASILWIKSSMSKRCKGNSVNRTDSKSFQH